MAERDDSFQCMVIAPQGKLIDCKAESVVFPAHDGYVGIWRNHMPMFCSVGLGMMEVMPLNQGPAQSKTKYMIINGGFLLMTHNELTTTASEAIFFEGMEAEKIEQFIDRAKKKLTTGTYTTHQLWVENKKISLMEQLAKRYTESSKQNAEAK
jgi:F-type H+-transporting ATPase subunit epsilon